MNKIFVMLIGVAALATSTTAEAYQHHACR